jgi:hypothetical protein
MDQEKAPYNEIEHRGQQRFQLKLPIYIRLVSRPNPEAQGAESFDISNHGVCFISEADLAVGEPIQITLSLPTVITGEPEEMRCFTGRIVHISQGGTRQRAIGVQFVYSEKICTAPH